MPYVKSTGGMCPLCSKLSYPLEEHHVSYKPEIRIKICHMCHFNIHHYPGRLTEAQHIMLTNIRGKGDFVT